MTDTFERSTNTVHPVFAGLAPSKRAPATAKGRHLAPREPSRLARSLHSTVPILLVGSMAISMNITSPIEATPAKRSTGAKQGMTELGAALREAMAAAKPTPATTQASADVATTAAPSTYRVVAGDTVSSIAGRFGLSTASVLALNGLSWSSLIFPGQTLKLTKGGSAPVPQAKPSTPAVDKYTIVSGDTVSRVAARFGVSTEAVLSANGLGWKSIIYPGQKLTIPSGKGSTPVSPPPASTPQTPSAGTYTIVSGDTVTAIAKKFGVSVQALLDANGLKLSSIIYAGKKLVIPGIVAASHSSGITPLTAEMRTNAKIIIQVGRDLGVSDYGIVIALATAAQESTLRNLNWGDRDSIGLFQQRPSAGWGTVSAIMDPVHSARLFYGGPTNPNKGKTRGLLDIAGWKSMSVTQAAQAVQISAYPNAYAKWEASARAWLAELG